MDWTKVKIFGDIKISKLVSNVLLLNQGQKSYLAEIEIRIFADVKTFWRHYVMIL